MKPTQPYCITFAGPVGCGKSQIAYYLSWQIGLGILNNDSIRTEVRVDTHSDKLDTEEYFARRDERIKAALNLGRNLIYDASIDRRWLDYKPQLAQSEWRWFIISFDLSRDFWNNILRSKGYDPESVLCDNWYQEHLDFLADSAGDVGLIINDDNYDDRLETSRQAIIKILH